MKKKEKKKRNWSNLLAVLALSVMLAVLLVGCKEPAEENPTPPTSEVVSEVVSEEVSEPVSEEPSEVASEEVVEEMTIDLSQYTNANGKKTVDLVADMNYEEFKIIVWKSDVGAEAILSNGASYQLQEDDLLALYFPNEMSDVQSNEHGDLYGGNEASSGFFVIGCGENMEVTFTGIDVNGKEYEITVYFTKDWKHSWEA